MRLLLLPVILLLLCGCYRYAPLQPTAIRPNASIRARISAEESDRLREVLPSQPRVLEGMVISADATVIVLEVASTSMSALPGAKPLHQRVSISHAGIQELESRRIDRTRTGLAGLAAVAVAGVVIFGAINGDPGLEGFPGDGTGPEFRVPLRLRR